MAFNYKAGFSTSVHLPALLIQNYLFIYLFSIQICSVHLSASPPPVGVGDGVSARWSGCNEGLCWKRRVRWCRLDVLVVSPGARRLCDMRSGRRRLWLMWTSGSFVRDAPVLTVCGVHAGCFSSGVSVYFDQLWLTLRAFLHLCIVFAK